MSNENIFSALGKYNSAIDENYLTESFVFLINSLLLFNGGIDRSIGCEFLTNICSVGNQLRFDLNESISVSTQYVTEQGTPDIKIFTPDKLIYIEVKHDSPIGNKQISRYKLALSKSPVAIKKVILLTRFPVDFKNEDETPYKHVRWYQIHNWLSLAKSEMQNPINVFLTDSFNSFLEVKQMSVQKVGWEYINGVPAMVNLVNMIEIAIQSAGIKLYPNYPRAVALEWRGFYLGNNEIWCGIRYNDPLKVLLQIVDKKKYDMHLVPKPTYTMHEDSKFIWFELTLEKYHFFSLDKDEQLELIMKFVKASYAEATQMRTSP